MQKSKLRKRKEVLELLFDCGSDNYRIRNIRNFNTLIINNMADEKIYIGDNAKQYQYDVKFDFDLGKVIKQLIGEDKERAKKGVQAFNLLYELMQEQTGFYAEVSKKDSKKKYLKVKCVLKENQNKEHSDYSITLNTWKKEDAQKKKDTPLAKVEKVTDVQVDDLPEDESVNYPF